MERIIPLVSSPLALSPALLQFGLAGVLAAAASLVCCQAVRLLALGSAQSRKVIRQGDANRSGPLPGSSLGLELCL